MDTLSITGPIALFPHLCQDKGPTSWSALSSISAKTDKSKLCVLHQKPSNTDTLPFLLLPPWITKLADVTLIFSVILIDPYLPNTKQLLPLTDSKTNL